MSKISLFYVVFAMLFIFACSEDIGVNDFKYQCNSDNECGAGYVCDKSKGCIKKESKDTGTDAGVDVELDVQDVSDALDVSDISDVEDILDVEEVGIDIEDSGVEAGDVADVVEDIEDAGDIEVVDAGEDVGDTRDTGLDGGIIYIMRLEYIYDSNAGVCASPTYTLESITGFTAADEMKNSNYVLHKSMLFKK